MGVRIVILVGVVTASTSVAVAVKWRARAALAPHGAVAIGAADTMSPLSQWVASAFSSVSDTTVVVAAAPVHGKVGQLVLDATMGTVGLPEEGGLSDIRQFAVARNGDVFVLDGNECAVRWFGPDGRLRGSLGRRGSGPGEFMSPSGVAIIGESRIAVHDPAQGRLVLMNLQTGREEAVVQVPVVSVGRMANSLLADTSGNLLLRHMTVHPIRTEAGREMQEVHAFVRVSVAGRILDTIPDPRSAMVRPSVTTGPGRGIRRHRIPFAPLPYAVWSPIGAFVMGNSGEYALSVVPLEAYSGIGGAHVLTVRRAIAPTPILPGEAKDHVKWITDDMRESDPRWVWNAPPIGTVKPYFRGVSVGRDGSIWVRLHTVAVHDPTVPLTSFQPLSLQHRWRESSLYDVFTSAGTYVGQVRGPTGVDLTTSTISGDTVWAAVRDSVGFAHVHRYRIVW